MLEVTVPVCLATDRSDLLLRQITVADAPAYVALVQRNQELLARYFDDALVPNITLAVIENMIRNPRHPKKIRLGLRLAGVLVGEVTFYPIREHRPRAVELGCWVDRDYRGLELAPCAVHTAMQYAYGELDIEYVQAYVHPENGASKRVLEKLQFTLTKESDGYHRYLAERPLSRE